MPLALALNPIGHLRLREVADAPPLDPALGQRLSSAFAAGTGPGLLHLGGVELGQAMPGPFAWWRGFAGRALTQARLRPDEQAELQVPTEDDLADLCAAAPPMEGVEYLSAGVLSDLWGELAQAFTEALARAGGSRARLLQALHPGWQVVGRVHFNLAENRRDPEAPFAFLATWTPRLSAQGRAQHLPLGRALKEYADAADRDALVTLLQPVQRAATACAWLAEMLACGELFHPLRWTAVQAFQLLQDAEALERAGVIVRMPANWSAGRPPRAKASASVGTNAPSTLGLDALVDFDAGLTVEGEPLSPAEAEALLRGTAGLAWIRGRWVEVDPVRLKAAMDRFDAVRRVAEAQGISFAEAVRLLAGAGIAGVHDEAPNPGWSEVSAGPWLAGTLRAMRAPDATPFEPGQGLQAQLRAYQVAGVRWLHLLTGLGLGALLADDMGLGTTIQVLALLLQRRREARRAPSLLVAPASLLSNWAAEAARFAPSLPVRVAHPSAMPAAELRALDAAEIATCGLLITSYGTLLRHEALASASYDLAILDEAQAVKNPNTQQSRAVRKLKARARVALTGTPVENRPGDLWSLFDFVAPGLLGSAPQFTRYTKGLDQSGPDAWRPLRELLRPWILRRLKTDKTVIADLPDKTEVQAWCTLSRKQAALYQQAVEQLEAEIETRTGIERRGLVLASLMRLKQICNHPSQWLGDGAWHEADSGKWARLREICEVIASRQEKVLVFTQFREIADPLATFLGGVFGRTGLVLHGGVPVRQRRERVEQFQQEDGPPFFVLSLKAGGSGLNLTAASHVVHFDRWWNPAVEDQATDRAFRIGQRRNVLVHRLACRGTVEQRIDELIASKRSLSRELLQGGGEIDLSSLGDAELLKLVALDLPSALLE